MTGRPDEEWVPPDDAGQRRQVDIVHEAEQAVLGAMLSSPAARAAVAETLISSDDFADPRHELIAHVINGMGGEHVDVLAVGDRLTPGGALRRIGGASYLHDLVQVASATSDHAAWLAETIIKPAAQRRRTAAGLTRGLNLLATQGADTADVLAVIRDIVDREMRDATDTIQVPPGLPVDEFLAQDPDDEPCWLVPGLLERQDRLIVTAAEGAGKSTLLRQMAVQVASGVHPFTLDLMTPRRVLLIDLENSARQTRRKLRALALAAGPHLEPAMLIVECRPEGLDLLLPEDRAWLDRIIGHHRPDMVVTGPIYKLSGGNPNDETEAKPAAMWLDKMRASHDIALILEAHTRKSETANPRHRSKEPFGWSGWMRWPEFGLHVDQDGTVSHWRGARETDRQWPERLVRGGVWPWTVADPARDFGDSKGFGGFRPTVLMERISRFVEGHPGIVKGEVEKVVTGKATGKRIALEILLSEGWIEERDGDRFGRKNLYSVTPYRGSSDPDGGPR